jgi:hypothetical protein
MGKGEILSHDPKKPQKRVAVLCRWILPLVAEDFSLELRPNKLSRNFTTS